MQKKFSYTLKIDDLNQNEYKFNLVADQDELKDIAQILKVESAKFFNAQIRLKLNNRTHMLTLWGNVQAELELLSVISLKKFTKFFDVPFELHFDTKATYKDIWQMAPSINDEVPDIIENNTLNLADIALEQIALNLDDYPRDEGEVFNEKKYSLADQDQKENPFAVLSKLKK